MSTGISVATERSHYVDLDGDSPRDTSTIGYSFDWQKQGPEEYLRLLATIQGPAAVVQGMHYGWVQEGDIAELIARMDSNERCAGVISSMSSRLTTERSTIGREATLLIEGFRRGHYPFFLNSDSVPITPLQEEQLRRWCARFMLAWKAKKAN